ncbi:MAG: ABC transporter substrate-binding protein [Ectothiorhodospiraceae bacterium AqS1]|nr:ABC transporter substrate-binding protein [Ectothiorhodospiraceae bacterium AqS1]
MHDRNGFGRKDSLVKAILGMVFTFALGSAAFADSPIRIGVLLPDTGVFAGLGRDQKDGLKMGFDDFGLEVAGRKIELIEADTESKPSAGLAQIKKLILRDKVDIVVGIVSSGVVGAVRNYAHGSKTPLIVTTAGNDRITGDQCSRWIVRASFSNSQINRDMGPWLAQRGYKKAFLIAFDYVAGHQMMDTFNRGFTAAGGEVIGESYPPLGEIRDFGPYLTEIKAAAPDLVYAFFSGGPAIKFVNEWAAFGMKDEVQLAGPGWLHSALYIDKQGEAALGTYSPLNYFPSIDTPENKDFQERFRQRYGRMGSEFGVAAYDSARLIVSALKKLEGKTDHPEELMQALLEVEFVGPRGPFRIDPKTHNVIQNIYVGRIEKQGDAIGAVIKHTFPDVQDPPLGCDFDEE